MISSTEIFVQLKFCRIWIMTENFSVKKAPDIKKVLNQKLFWIRLPSNFPFLWEWLKFLFLSSHPATPLQPITSGARPSAEPEAADLPGRHYNFAEPTNNGSGYTPGVAPGPNDPPTFVADAPPPSYDEVVNPSAPPFIQPVPDQAVSTLHAKNRTCRPGGYYWDYYPGALSLIQVTVTHLKIRHP